MKIVETGRKKETLESIGEGAVFMFFNSQRVEYYIKTADYDSGAITVVNLHDGSVSNINVNKEVICVNAKLVIE